MQHEAEMPKQVPAQVSRRPKAAAPPQLGKSQADDGSSVGNSKVEFFSYSPKTAMLTVGQKVELWPPAHIMGTGLSFKAIPCLPPGFKIEEETGIISGAGLMPTAGLLSFFVSGEEPLTGVVQVAGSVQLHIVDYYQSAVWENMLPVQAPGL